MHNEQSIPSAIGEYQRFLNLKPETLHIYPVLSELHMKDTELGNALNSVKECLRRDPEERSCMKLFKIYKKFEKKIIQMDVSNKKNKWRDVINVLIQDGFIVESEEFGTGFAKKAYSLACEAHSKIKRDKEAIEWCSKVLFQDQNDFEALFNRAESYLRTEEYQNGLLFYYLILALNDYEKANGINNQDQKVRSGHQKAKKLLQREKMVIFLLN